MHNNGPRQPPPQAYVACPPPCPANYNYNAPFQPWVDYSNAYGQPYVNPMLYGQYGGGYGGMGGGGGNDFMTGFRRGQQMAEMASGFGEAAEMGCGIADVAGAFLGML